MINPLACKNLISYITVYLLVGFSPLSATEDVAPTVTPSGRIVAAYQESASSEIDLSSSGGTAPSPTEEAPCPPWQTDGSPRYEWSTGAGLGINESHGTESQNLKIPKNQTGTGSFKVKIIQDWIDQDSATATTESAWSADKEVNIGKVGTPDPGRVCDGAEVPISLEVTPQSLAGDLSGVSIAVEKSGGGQNYDNPAGEGSTAQKGDSESQWSIPNARWFSTQADHCNVTSDYTLKCTGNFGNDNFTAPDMTLTVDASVGMNSSACIWGKADPTDYWEGDIVINVTAVSGTGNFPFTEYHATIANTGATPFKKALKVDVDYFSNTSSQYYTMVKNEEEYHAEQFKGTKGTVCLGLWDPGKVLQDAQADQPYKSTHQQEAINKAKRAFASAKQAEMDRSSAFIVANRCDLEKEAKLAVNASHRGTAKCAYGCP